MASALESALSRLRAAFQAIHLYLPLPGAAAAQEQVSQSIGQLDDYVLPRLREIRAPLLVIVGGSTGAGKSTLVNSIIGHAVSPTGVIRPTTKSPVLVHHPEDSDWFAGDRVLSSLARSAGSFHDLHTLRVVPDLAMPRGMAVLDAPDIDSIDVENRVLAAQLLAAGDLWLFITSATRYADAVPWDYLQQAVDRSAAVAVVLDRVPPAAMAEVPAHLASMMTESGLGNSPFFAVPETVVDEQGMLPKAAVEPIRSWLAALASDQRTRGLVVMKTLDGSIAALAAQAPRVVEGLSEQLRAVDGLRQDSAAAFIDAVKEVSAQTRDGLLLRDEVLSRWQDYVGAGDIARSMESRMSRLRDRVTHRLRGEPVESDNAHVAVGAGLEALLVQAGQRACERAEAAWLANPAGRHIIDRTGVRLGQPSADFRDAAAAAVRHWQSDILNLVSAEGSNRRVQARVAALGVNAVGVSLMLVAFAHTGGLAGAEIGIAGGTAVVAQKTLELVFGDEAVRRLAKTAKELLDSRTKELMSSQLGRFTTVLESLRLDPSLPHQILALAEEIDSLRSEELVSLSLQAVLTPTEQAAIVEVEGASRDGAAGGLEQLIASRTPALASGGSA
ncbi:MAG: dynamin family protein [Propionibacteriaceae bacterium]|nr:dynamin family protein [Propionibacteriaceae bacterium]